MLYFHMKYLRPTGSYIRGSLAGLFLWNTAASAADEPILDIQTHGTPETIERLGGMAERLPAWAGNKPVVILSKADFGEEEITEDSIVKKLQEISGLIALQAPNSHRLKSMIKSLNNNDATALAYKTLHQTICLITDKVKNPVNSIAAFTGFAPDLIERVPGTDLEWAAFTMGHETGHCAKGTSALYFFEWGKILTGEINADQRAADIEREEEFSIPSTTHISRDVTLARTIGMIHRYSNPTHFTGPGVFLPGEEPVEEFKDGEFIISNTQVLLSPVYSIAAMDVSDPQTWQDNLNLCFQVAHSDLDILPEATKGFLKVHENEMQKDIKDLPLQNFLSKYADEKDFISFLKQITGGKTAEKRDKESIRIMVNAASVRLAELRLQPQSDDILPRLEKRILKQYLDAVENFFPETFRTVRKRPSPGAPTARITASPEPLPP